MLDIFLMRHAKSSWENSSLDDYHRPLNKRGKKAAPLMAEWMIDNGYSKPDLLLCSSARRCKDTYKLMRAEGLNPKQRIYMQSLYLASSAELVELIKASDKTARSLMIIGHNPGLHILAKALISSGKDGVSGAFGEKFPTAALVHIQFDVIDWTDVAPDKGTLYRYVTPKQIGS